MSDPSEAGAPSTPPSSLISPEVTCRASSVLRRNVRQFGTANMFDGKEDTCWNSDQGTPQTLELRFPQPVRVADVVVTFQGGFVGQDVDFTLLLPATASASPGDSAGAEGAWVPAGHAEPDDVNVEQVFPLDAGAAAALGLRIVFGRSTDFYGRVTVYKLDVRGWRAAGE
jgi:hypothetical protein